MATPTGEPGLQPERTQLAWERTTIGFLTVGALVLLRHGELPFPGRSVAAAMAFSFAIMVMLIGKARSVGAMTSHAAIYALGGATAALATVIGVLILSLDT
jgi:uncharacterized membrane protein YidH (DUF202 family)